MKTDDSNHSPDRGRPRRILSAFDPPEPLEAQTRALLERMELAICRIRAGSPVPIGGDTVIRALELCPQGQLGRKGRLVLPSGLRSRRMTAGERRRSVHPVESGHGRGACVIELAPSAEPTRIIRWIASSSERGELGRMLASAGRGNATDAAAIELCKLAGLLPAALIETQTSDAGAGISVEDVLGFRDALARSVRPMVEARLPIRGAENAALTAFRAGFGGVEHVAIRIGDVETGADAKPPLCRLHSSCLTGDLFGSLRCDCGDQLDGAIRRISEEGSGIILYLAQEGRGIGLVNKLRAYRLQDEGLDTIEANEHLGFLADERNWLMPAIMLQQLGIGRIRLLTNNPAKVSMIQKHGIEVVERVPHAFAANPHNHAYLATKAERGGHFLGEDIVRRRAGEKRKAKEK